MMPPPSLVWIGCYELAIVVVPASDDRLDKGDSDGLFDSEASSIYLKDGLSAPLLMETIWHELTHAVDWAADIEDGVLEEDIADRHAKIWSLFWVNNPRFQRWWTRTCNAVRKEREAGRRVRA